ncbi:PGDYG domain-containing protein [Massilia horti]|uniref:Uncharacterized protein n=1 Tax=Massilia horti TaxID=2562153 RepID=A0A4Y9T8P1_9BURK|nr:PGDYG domain-containing protein [Massilia horti]TFW35568.1 hypothetical protein E4O92_01895 [Massilia horti]
MTDPVRTYDSRTDSLRSHAGAIPVRKRPQVLMVQFATTSGQLETLEGPVAVAPGDAIVTGSGGERWPVTRRRFESRYTPVAPCRPGEEGPYQGLAVSVLALQVGTPFAVILANGITHLHGRPGDWLVDYGDGNLGLVAQALFPSLYERGPVVPRASNGNS